MKINTIKELETLIREHQGSWKGFTLYKASKVENWIETIVFNSFPILAADLLYDGKIFLFYTNHKGELVRQDPISMNIPENEYGFYYLFTTKEEAENLLNPKYKHAAWYTVKEELYKCVHLLEEGKAILVSEDNKKVIIPYVDRIIDGTVKQVYSHT